TVALGINDTGNVAGYYGDGTGTHGFTYDGSTYSTLNVPGASGTHAFGINDTGSVAGYYSDGTGSHGFIATPSSVPEPSTILLLGSGLAGFAGIGIMRRRKKG
ncbi:MAG: PEP-CTERM sorting domain-containing protein, partial [Deltaproteobacteria bacterium]|nr:PEP-CTERM sorting domain-containing protein [Deltaproteobacteria bacterium]